MTRTGHRTPRLSASRWPPTAVVIAVVIASATATVGAQRAAIAPTEATKSSLPSADERAAQEALRSQLPSTTGGAASELPASVLKWMRRLGLTAEDSNRITGNIGVVVAGSALSGGARFRKADIAGTGIGIETDGLVSYRRYQAYRVAIGRLASRGSTFELNAADTRVASLFNHAERRTTGSAAFLDVRFRRFPRHVYSGTGIESPPESRSDYTLELVTYDGVAQVQLTSALGLGARAGWMDVEIGAGHNRSLPNIEQTFTPDALPGGTSRRRFVVVGGALEYDSRSTRRSGSGAYLGAVVRHFRSSTHDRVAFIRTSLDGRAYRNLRAQHLVAVRAILSADRGASNAASPFYLRDSLGGGETLRGFRPYRFQDMALLHGTAEYRWGAHRFVEVAPYIDVGTVAARVSDIDRTPWQVSSGLGLRARNGARVLARLDWAYGREGHRLTLGIGSPF